MEFPTLLNLKLDQATLFKNVLEAVSDMFSMANFDFSDTGCELQAMDSNSVALVVLFLRKELFNDYHCCDRGLSIGLNLAGMAEVFRCANNDDIITIEAEEDFSNIVTFTFESPKDGEVWSFDFDFEAVDGVPFEIPEPSESEYSAIVRMPSAKFMRICKKLSSAGDSLDKDRGRDTFVSIWVDKEGVHFIARGKNGTSAIVCSQTQESTLVEMKKEVYDLTFALKYIISFSKASTLSDQVTIFLSSDKEKAAVFQYEMAGMSYIRYYMGPYAE